jgi:hypothetical protein
MTKIGTYTVGAGTDSSVSFTNIPQTYTDLIVKVSGHLTGTGFGAATIKLIFNSSTSGYSWRSVLTDSAGGSYSQKGDSVAFIEAGILPASQSSPTVNVFGIADMLISNYSSNNSKAVSIDYAQESGGVDNYIGFVSGIWSNTAPVTSLTITPNSSNFSQYSTFTLYGVKSMRAAAGNSIKATGGSVNFDGTYVTHTFNTTGVFTPTANLRVDYLVVAGGGGAGGYISGGGGAGGLRSTVTATGGGGTLETALSLTSGTNYTVTVGAGGAGGTANASGTAGSNSVFSTITSTGGGYGSYFVSSLDGGAGGSGGGAGSRNSRAGGTGTANQGFAGGASDAGNNIGGGGGGAGAVGTTVVSAGTVANGGNGVAVSITGSSVFYAGGGGGGTANPTIATAGGSGGGGAGNTSNAGNGSNGTTNTGGGGGGASHTSSSGIGGTGGSGIVIIRYKG